MNGYKVEIKPSYEWDKKAKELGITGKEIEVFALMTEGYKNKEIAEKMGINYQSVKNHYFRFAKKLGVKNSNQALVVALHLNLIRVRYESEYVKADIDAKGVLNELKKNKHIKAYLKEHGIDPDRW